MNFGDMNCATFAAIFPIVAPGRSAGTGTRHYLCGCVHLFDRTDGTTVERMPCPDNAGLCLAPPVERAS